MEGGRVLLPRSAAWLRDFETEVLSFPVGAHDDIVDCLSYAVAVQNNHSGSSLLLGQSSGGRRRPRRPTIKEMFADMGPNDPGDPFEGMGLGELYEPWDVNDRHG